MIGLHGLLTVYVLFAVFGLLVLAAFAVSGSQRNKTERRQPSERQRDIRAGPLRPPPAAYPSKAQSQVPQMISKIPKLVRIDRQPPVRNLPPADKPIDAEIVAALSDEDTPTDTERPVIDTDGETYTASPPIPPKPTAPSVSISNAALRQWARESGLSVADRGPIPSHVREAWAQANP
jgi:hypothetical protein